ncbi:MULTISPECIES: hypothetical protein [Sphingobacterium]|uniref:hypothetical protein n=1 Tax=Sphingobacterium TaxID=28453 RepID=UPI001969F9AD|nr:MULTISPECIES: hypothetical protein [unclassified Sphingobacterium]
MKIIEPKKRDDLQITPKLHEAFGLFEKLIYELNKKNLPETTVEFINQRVEELNTIPSSDKSLKKQLLKRQAQMTKFLEKEHKLVPKNYYRNLWIPLGMSAFGLPFGVALGLVVDNMGLLGVGLPIGLAIGAIVGTQMDKQALKDGRQLDTDLKYT